ncbi:MAG: hypothetical protein KJ645_08425 [Planctomycetes bacterium]|nr:hypothetical protein [Planctomycetota bacterium]
MQKTPGKNSTYLSKNPISVPHTSGAQSTARPERKSISNKSQGSISVRSNNRSKVSRNTVTAIRSQAGDSTGPTIRVPDSIPSSRPAFEYKPRQRSQDYSGLTPPAKRRDPNAVPDPDPDIEDPPESGEQESENQSDGNDDQGYIDPNDIVDQEDDPDDYPVVIIYCNCCGHPWWECCHNHYWSPVCWSYCGHVSWYWDSYWNHPWKDSIAQYQKKYNTNDYCPSIYTPIAMVTDAGDRSLEYLDQGAQYFRQGMYLEALQFFRLAALADLNAPIPKFAYAHALFALGIYEYAAYEIRQGLALMPDWPRIGGDLTLMYDGTDDFEKQLMALQEYLAVNDHDEDALFVLGYISFFSGDLFTAEETFQSIAATASMGNASMAGLFIRTIESVKNMLEDAEEKD